MSPTAWDEAVMRWVAGHRADWLTHLAFGVMDVGTTAIGLAMAALLAVVLVARARYRWPLAAAAVAWLVVGLLANGLKQLFDRPRPPVDLALLAVGGTSFPSTQAAETAAVAAAVLVATTWSSRTVRRAVTVAAGVGLVGIGACMVYLGAHWTTDVLAGWVLGAAGGTASGWCTRRLATRPAAARRPRAHQQR